VKGGVFSISVVLSASFHFSYHPAMRCFVLGLIGLLLAGCASPAYRAFDGSIGYSQAQTAPSEWDVSFVAPADMGPARSIELATLRAAELTLQQNKSHFEIVQRENSTLTSLERTAPFTDIYESIDRDGGRRNQVFTQSGGVRTVNRPATMLTVKLLDAPSDRSLDARAIVDDARRRGLLPAPK
jgi:hypothetical protein